MTFRQIEKSLENFKNISEAPRLREVNRHLQKTIRDLEKAHKEKVLKLENEVERLQKIIFKNEIKIKQLETRRIKYKGSYSEKEFEALVEKRIRQKENEQISEAVQRAWDHNLPGLIETEVKRYPYNCNPITRDIIEKKAIELRDKMLNEPAHWPIEFKNKVNIEAEKRSKRMMDEKFDERVKRASNARLWKLINEEWPLQ